MMQILTTLPDLQIEVPSNVVFFIDVFLDIVNFQVIDKESLYEFFTSNVIQSGDDSKSNIVMNSLFFIMAIIFLSILILLIYLCRKKLLPKCPGWMQKLILKIEGKLMFNSLLRGLL